VAGAAPLGDVETSTALPLDVSVVMPTWNRVRFLRASIDAVLAQTAPIRELIIADDGSEAPARALLEEYAARPGIRVLWRERCGIPAAVRNAAIRDASGRYVAFADSDDVWDTDKLARQAAALRARPDCRWSFTSWSCIDVEDQPIPALPDIQQPRTGPLVDEVARFKTTVALPSVLAERTLLLEAGLFVENLRAYEDYDLWVRLAALSDAARIREPLVKVRRHDEHYLRDEPCVALEARDFYLARAARLVRTPAARAELRRMRASNSARLWKMRARRIVARWW
jgi:glycosyltransferase involved in cell wall biosynthesis